MRITWAWSKNVHYKIVDRRKKFIKSGLAKEHFAYQVIWIMTFQFSEYKKWALAYKVLDM